MPKVFSEGPFDFYFYSNEGHEPIHVHVRKGSPRRPDAEAKYWLNPTRKEYSDGFIAAEDRRIISIINARRDEIRDAWDGHFGS